jgi:hypothetical protein
VLIAPSADDEVIPTGHGRLLHAAAKNSIYIEFQGGHNQLRSVAEHERRDAEIDAFIDEHVRGSTDRAGPIE